MYNLKENSQYRNGDDVYLLQKNQNSSFDISRKYFQSNIRPYCKGNIFFNYVCITIPTRIVILLDLGLCFSYIISNCKQIIRNVNIFYQHAIKTKKETE